MGGTGSGGNPFGAARPTVEDQLSLDVRALHRQGLLKQGITFDWSWSDGERPLGQVQARVEPGQVMLAYDVVEEDVQAHYQYPVALDHTHCNFGGWRSWFRCPLLGCGRRVAILYLGPQYFGCRHCYGLAFASQHATGVSRRIRRAQALRVRLGGSSNLALPFPAKPKGMHTHTYQRLLAKAAVLEEAVWADLERRIPSLARGTW